MAYAFASASSQYLSSGSVPVTTYPLTMAAWIKPSSLAAPGAIVSVENTSTGHRFILQQNAANGSHVQVTAADASGAAGGGSITTGLTTGTWYHAAGTLASNFEGDWLPYLSASRANSTNLAANYRSPSNVNGTKIGARTSASLGLYFAGDIAEVGIWNVALTAAEIASLAKGFACSKVRPQSLVFYAPLVRDLIDARGGLTITNNNTATVANHLRVYA